MPGMHNRAHRRRRSESRSCSYRGSGREPEPDHGGVEIPRRRSRCPRDQGGAGGPSHQFDPQAYVRFLYACASDARFNADNLIREIAGVYKLSPIESVLYRYVLIPQTRQALLKQKEQFAFMDHKPDWGSGRIDPFNPIKFGILKLPVDDTIGNSDMVSLFNQKARKGMSLHWDGLNTSGEEVALSSAIGDGATRKYIQRENLKRVEDWIMDLQPPKYPFPVNAALARITDHAGRGNK